MNFGITVDDGRMTPGCVNCPEWHDRRDGDGGACSLPKSAAVTECPYLREMILKKCKENSHE